MKMFTTAGRALLMLLVIVACAGTQRAHAQATPPTTLIIRAGDVLQISVWPDIDKNLSGDYLVEETGRVNLPLIGAVQVGGLDIEAVRADLRRRYAVIITQPAVTVTPMFSVGVAGAVRQAGVYAVKPGQTLFDAIIMAGGFAPRAKTREVRFIREGVVTKVDAKAAMETGGSNLEIPLRSGDRIMVLEGSPFTLITALSLTQTLLVLATFIRSF